MIFTNPGGPGESGIDFLVAEARMATRIVGDNYDLVAWEPRGVGYSVPLANCSVPASNLGSAKSRLVRRALDSGDYEFPASLFEAVYDEAGALGESCKSEIGGMSLFNSCHLGFFSGTFCISPQQNLLRARKFSKDVYLYPSLYKRVRG